MDNMELLSETIETTKIAETAELLEQKAALQIQLEAAQNAGNLENANYLNGELAELDKQLDAAEQASGSSVKSGQEISFGAAYSESYYKNKAAEEYAENGESDRYRSLMKQAGEAHIENR